MNFMGVGPAELLVILVVALIFVGPERLPRLAADIARTIREIRKYTGNIAAEFTEVIEDIERETADDRSQWKDIGEGLTNATKSVAGAIHNARADAEGKPAASGAVAALPPPAPSEAPAPAPDSAAEAAPTATTNGASPSDEPSSPPAVDAPLSAPASPANGATPNGVQPAEHREEAHP